MYTCELLDGSRNNTPHIIFLWSIQSKKVKHVTAILLRIINTAVDEIQLYDRVRATILQLIYENNKDSVTQNNQTVNGKHHQTNRKQHLEFYKISW